MEYNGHKYSAEGSLIMVLINEEDDDETRSLKGKDRLEEAWSNKKSVSEFSCELA